MILAAGLTPAWQQILTFEHFRLGEVNRAADVAACASGKVLNVGAALHHLGASSLTLCPVGGTTGQQIRDDFASLGIPAEWTTTQTPTRVCTTLLDRASGQTTELVENSAPLTPEELETFAERYGMHSQRADFVVLSGSLPQGTSRSYYAHLLEQTSCPVLLDARGPELRECLPFRPWLVKPNREELAMTVGRPLADKDAIVAAIRELQSAGARHVVVSDGRSALYAADAAGVEEFAPPTVAAVNPIGCGDCLAAGLAIAAVEGRPWRDSVAFGMAAAGENACHLLPARFGRSAVEARLRSAGF